VGGTLIADSTTFIPPTINNGTTYYYVVVSGFGLPAVSLISGPVIVEDLGPVTLNPASVSINAGDSVTITASGALTYSWVAFCIPLWIK
jgi:hypothetical protein